MNFFVLCLLSMFDSCYRLIVVSFLLSSLSYFVCYLFMIWISFLLLLSITDNDYVGFGYV